jgi:hypothetical protein
MRPLSPLLLRGQYRSKLKRQAHLRGVSLETLVNLWLQQKLNEEAQPAAV